MVHYNRCFARVPHRKRINSLNCSSRYRRDDGRAYLTSSNIIIIMIDRQLKTVSVVGWCGWVKGSIDRGGRAPNEL